MSSLVLHGHIPVAKVSPTAFFAAACMRVAATNVPSLVRMGGGGRSRKATRASLCALSVRGSDARPRRLLPLLWVRCRSASLGSGPRRGAVPSATFGALPHGCSSELSVRMRASGCCGRPCVRAHDLCVCVCLCSDRGHSDRTFTIGRGD